MFIFFFNFLRDCPLSESAANTSFGNWEEWQCFSCIMMSKDDPRNETTLEILNEPRHDKMYLREFPTRPDTNRPAQPQKLARDLKFRL